MLAFLEQAITQARTLSKGILVVCVLIEISKGVTVCYWSKCIKAPSIIIERVKIIVASHSQLGWISPYSS